MEDIKSISAKLWRLIVRVVLLLFGLSRQIVLPTRTRKGNILNTFFLFYIGVIENLLHFEHREFKLADVFQNKMVRKGLLLFSFLLFLLTSFELPLASHFPANEVSKIQYSYRKTDNASTSERVVTDVRRGIACLPMADVLERTASPSVFVATCGKLYLQNRRLLI